MNNRLLILVIALFLITVAMLWRSCNNDMSTPERPRDAPVMIVHSLNNKLEKLTETSSDVIAENLEVPWAMTFLPDQSLMITERQGKVKVLEGADKKSTRVIYTIEQVRDFGEGGLHGIALHPGFNKNKFIYFYYTYFSKENENLNRVVRYKFENKTLSERTIIVNNIPGAKFHNGGRIKFGPDQLLYITTGDALQKSLSQDKNSLAGKILRVTEDGNPAPGNPFNNLVFSYGHRNPQGITWDESGRLWSTEHGSNAHDELNLIEAGRNYGWPEIRGDEKMEGMETPIAHSGKDTWAPAGAAYLNGSVYFGGLRGKALYEAKINGKKVEISTHFKKEFGRIRAVIAGSDNMLYISTSNRDGRGFPSLNDDRIIRIDPQHLGKKESSFK